jgi:hypothetical protein
MSRRCVTEKKLHVEFPRVLLDCPGGKGVAEAMRVDFWKISLAPEAAEQLLEPVRAQTATGPEYSVPGGSDEERAANVAPEG